MTRTSAAPMRWTADDIRLPARMRLINAVGSLLPRAVAKATVEGILEDAKKVSGLHDWGDDSFQEALRVLIDSVNGEAKLHLVGAIMFKASCIKALKVRMQVVSDVAKHPEISRTPILRPLFILGLPRTGTTLLHNLLAQDPKARALLSWESENPVPPPEPHAMDQDPRIGREQRSSERFLATYPAFASVNPPNPTGPRECNVLLGRSFSTIAPFAGYRVPAYTDWLLEQNQIPAYECYKSQLQHLGWKFPGRHWVLKEPGHLFFLDALFHVFPDARVVQLHRDPVKVVPSMCSLATLARRMRSNKVDPKEVGSQWSELLCEGVNRAIAYREQADGERFADLAYEKLVADPVGAVREIYDYFGYPFNEVFESALRQWLNENRTQRGKAKPHHYSLAQFGLNAESLNRQFSTYRDRFAAYL